MRKSALDDIMQRLQTLQHELEEEIDRLLRQKRKQFQYSLEQGKVRFEQGMRMLLKKHEPESGAICVPLPSVICCPRRSPICWSFPLS